VHNLHPGAAAGNACLDSGKPVAVHRVNRELRHNATDMVEAVYGKLGEIRHRSEQG
jgi:hypothetical protein